MDIRVTNDGAKHPDALNAKPHYGLLFIDDGSGFVSASTPTAEVVDAAPVTVGAAAVTNGIAQSVAAGSLTVARRGMYRAGFSIGDILSGNASVVTVEIYKNGAVIASTAGAIKAKMTFAGTAVLLACAAQGLVAADVGDIFTLRVTGTVGTVTIKNLRFELAQIADT